VDTDPIAVALRMARILGRLDVPYVIGGSVASMLRCRAESPAIATHLQALVRVLLNRNRGRA